MGHHQHGVMSLSAHFLFHGSATSPNLNLYRHVLHAVRNRILPRHSIRIFLTKQQANEEQVMCLAEVVTVTLCSEI
jgi:hypothetical protein